MLQIGSVLEDRYKILCLIGQGGISSVYLALDERANKTWAVREVRKKSRDDYEIYQSSLVAEVELLKRLDHPNLPHIFEVLDYGDSFIFVLDYIEGQDLAKKLKKEGAQPPEKVLSWGKQLCSVLSYLHSQDPPIIYRDMKPANLMLRPNGEDVCIIDFGTVHTIEDDPDGFPFVARRDYQAPETFGEPAEYSVRSDIYTVGATLYHLLTGVALSNPVYYMTHLLREFDPAYQDTGWEQILSKCCRENPDDRYQSCEELLFALEHLEQMPQPGDSKFQKWRKNRSYKKAFAEQSFLNR